MNSLPPSPPFVSRLWPTLVLVVAALGVPATTIALFTRFVTEHPLLALGIGLLYEVALFVLGFVGKVWGQLEKPLVERTATRLDHLAQSILSRYRKQYCDYLRYQHRDFDVKGLSTLSTYMLELDQVFVELRVDPTTPQQATSNPLQIPQTLLQGSHAIWDYLASAPLSNQHLVIIGPPGSGKTTLLKHITLTLASQRNPRHHLHQGIIRHQLPMLLFLRDHAQTIKETPDFSLVDAVHDHLKKWEQPPPPVGWMKQQLARGRFLVMLDGLDEVADPEVRQATVNWVERQMAAHRQNRFLVTSRPFGYKSNPLSGVTVLGVHPFTIEQVERFVHQWYLANEIMGKQKDDPGVRMRAKAEARTLLQQLHNTPALFALTVNPLLLTMIATVHRFGGELPGNRVALYAEIREVFLGKRQKARGQVLELTPAQMQLVLETLAYHMMLKGTRDIALDEVRTVIEEPLARVSSQMSPEAFLRLVEQASGLLLERENSIYSFAHLTFQEYLAASQIREKQMGHTLQAYVGATWWHETIRLYCAMADATPIIAACLAGDRPSAAAVELAIDCDKEAREVRPEMRTRLETLLTQGVEDPDPERQHVIARALLARRLRRMVHLKDETYVDTSLITCAEYQVFLDERRARGQYLQPDHWTSYHFPPGQGNVPVLGVRSSDATAFCAWLTEHESGPWQYRLPKVGELAKERIADALRLGTGYWLAEGEGYVLKKADQALPMRALENVVEFLFTIALASALASGLASTLTSASGLARDLTSALALARDLPSASDRASALASDLALASTRDRASDLARIRKIIVEQASNLAPYPAMPSKQQAEDVIQHQIEGLRYIYRDLIILEGRIQGKLQACEGILIVKERK